MTVAEDQAAVVELACLTGDRTKAEQKALLRVAQRVDREINRQVSPNPHIDGPMTWPPPPCTFAPGEVHGKDCGGCSGDGRAWEPRRGWSRLAAMVEASWEPA